MSTSNVKIANGALQRLGAKRIEALTQDSPNARSMNAAFERVRRRLLRRYDWAFAIVRASVAADADDTLWGNLNRYTLPGDYIRLLRDNESGYNPDWKIEGLYIVTADASPLQFRYIADITDPNYFDAGFIEAFECLLALECCEEITQSSGKKASLREDFETAVAEARRTGAIERGSVDEQEDSWVTAAR